MPDFLESAVAESLPDPSVSFVFPSEVAADSWARRALSLAPEPALFTDRFLGWDTFKARLLSRRAPGRAANDTTRLLWAASALDANARSPFLETLLRPEYRSEFSGYVPFVAAVLPTLRRIADRAGARPDSGKIRDLLALYTRYRSFLSERGLYEPSWEPPPSPEPGSRWILFCPELARDWEEYRPTLAASDGVRILGLPESSDCPPLAEFPNLHEELRWIFLSVAKDLDSGMRPEEIAVTVPDLDETAPWVEKAADLAGVPAEIRSGLPLARHPVGRFLSSVGSCAERDFDLESVSALLLDRFLPWKEPDRARSLVRFGIRRHAYAPYAVDGRTRDPWLESFRVCGVPEPGLDSFYRRLKAGVRQVARAADFRSLAQAFVAFRREFLDETRLSEEDARSFQRAMDELSALGRTEADLDLGAPEDTAFPLFRTVLEDRRYVPQSSAPAVPVYSYRVSALLAVRRHYVAGASQEGIRVRFVSAPGLGDEEKAALGLPDLDASQAYARAYASVGQPVFSFPKEGFRGWNLPYPWFSREGRVGPAPDYASLRESDPWVRETRAYDGDGFPPALLPAQSRAFRSALRSLGGPEVRQERASAAAAERILDRVRRADGRLRLSATQVSELLSCPFAWLLARGLGLKQEVSGVGFFDALLAGEMIHEALRLLYRRIAESGPYDDRRLDEYRAWVRPSVEGILPRFEAEHGPFLRPMFEAYIPKLADRIERLLEEEAETFRGWEVESLEGELEKDYADLEAVLVGRLDRLARRDGQTAIIDYKKRSIPKKEDVVPDPEGNLADLQMAAYVLLCEAAGRTVSRARYWSVEDVKPLDVLGPGVATREDYQPALDAFERGLKETAEKLRAGDYLSFPPENRSCGNCPWTSICRTGYATEGS